MKLLVLFAVLFALPAAAFAQAGIASATAHVYIYDTPEVSVFLVETEEGLICSWDIKDKDKEDTFEASVQWTRDGEPFAAETIDCGSLKHCAAHEKPEVATGETWVCSVTVEDSYNATATASAEFYKSPLGFFGGLLHSLLSFFGLA